MASDRVFAQIEMHIRFGHGWHSFGCCCCSLIEVLLKHTHTQRQKTEIAVKLPETGGRHSLKCRTEYETKMANVCLFACLPLAFTLKHFAQRCWLGGWCWRAVRRWGVAWRKLSAVQVATFMASAALFLTALLCCGGALGVQCFDRERNGWQASAALWLSSGLLSVALSHSVSLPLSYSV